MKLKFNKVILPLIPLFMLSGVLLSSSKDGVVKDMVTKASANQQSRAVAPNTDKIYAINNSLTYMSGGGYPAKFNRKKSRGLNHADAYCMNKSKNPVSNSTASGTGGNPFNLAKNSDGSAYDAGKKLLYAMEYNTGLSGDQEYYVRAMGVHYLTGDYAKMTKRGGASGNSNVCESTWVLRENLDNGHYPTSQDVSVSLSPSNINLYQNGTQFETNWINLNINWPSTATKSGIAPAFSPVLKYSIVTVSGAPAETQVIRNNGSVAYDNNIGTDTRFWIRIPASSVTGTVSISVSVKSVFEVGVARKYNPTNTSIQPMSVRATMDKTVSTGTIYSNSVTGGGNLVVTKRGTDGSGYWPLSGARFQLRGSVNSSELTTDNNGKVTFQNMPAGTYTLVETSVPWGYHNPGNKTVTISGGQTSYITVDNVRARGDFKVIKRDESGRPLQGAKFQLQNGSTVSAGPFTTDANGEVIFRNMPTGGYSLVEVSAPEGYLIDGNQNWQIIEVSHGVMNQIVITNKTIKGNIQVTKLDSLDSNRTLSGAEFKLYNSSGGHVATAQSDGSGVARFNNIPYGRYTVKETKAPVGYVLNPDPISFNVTTNGQTYYGQIFDNRERDMSIPAYNIKNSDNEIVGTLKKNKTYKFNFQIKNEYTNLTLPSNATLGTPNIEKIKYAIAVNDGSVNQSASSITTSNLRGTVIKSGTMENVPIRDLSSIWKNVSFTTPNDEAYSEIVFVVELECSKDANSSNNKLVVKLPIRNDRSDTISIVNMEVYPNTSGSAIVGNDVNVMVDVVSNSLKSYDVNTRITIQGPTGFGTKNITKTMYGVSMEEPGKVYFKFKPTVVGTYTITSRAQIPGSTSTSGSKTITVVHPSAPSVYYNSQQRTQVSYNESGRIKTYVKVKKRDKDKIGISRCASPCQTDEVTGSRSCPQHETWVWNDWYDAFIPRKNTVMTGIEESFNITKLEFRSKFTENNASKYPLYIDSDGYVDLLDPNSAKYAQVKAGYGFEIKAKTSYKNNLPSIFRRAALTSNTVPSNTDWSEYRVIPVSGDIPLVYDEQNGRSVDSQVSSYSGIVSVTVPSLSDLIIESPNQLYMKLPDGSNEYYMVDEGYGQRFSDNRIKQRLFMPRTTGVTKTNTAYVENKEFEIKKDITNLTDKRGYYIGKNVKDGVNVISVYNRYAGYGLKNSTRLHDNKSFGVKVYGGRYDDLKDTNE